jgi:hypothetical protein
MMGMLECTTTLLDMSLAAHDNSLAHWKHNMEALKIDKYSIRKTNAVTVGKFLQ